MLTEVCDVCKIIVIGILLTRTRQGVLSLVDFIREFPELRGRVFPDKLVGQGRKEGTMTDVEQEKTLRLFRQGQSFAILKRLIEFLDFN